MNPIRGTISPFAYDKHCTAHILLAHRLNREHRRPESKANKGDERLELHPEGLNDGEIRVREIEMVVDVR